MDTHTLHIAVITGSIVFLMIGAAYIQSNQKKIGEKLDKFINKWIFWKE